MYVNECYQSTLCQIVVRVAGDRHMFITYLTHLQYSYSMNRLLYNAYTVVFVLEQGGLIIVDLFGTISTDRRSDEKHSDAS